MKHIIFIGIKVFTFAAHFEILKWAYDNGCPCSKMLTEIFALSVNSH